MWSLPGTRLFTCQGMLRPPMHDAFGRKQSLLAVAGQACSDFSQIMCVRTSGMRPARLLVVVGVADLALAGEAHDSQVEPVVHEVHAGGSTRRHALHGLLALLASHGLPPRVPDRLHRPRQAGGLASYHLCAHTLFGRSQSTLDRPRQASSAFSQMHRAWVVSASPGR